MAKMFRKAGPNEAIIVYGFRGRRVIKGGGAVIFPVVENSRQLSLELMSSTSPHSRISIPTRCRRNRGGRRPN